MEENDEQKESGERTNALAQIYSYFLSINKVKKREADISTNKRSFTVTEFV